MPIEIKELVIRAVAAEERPSTFPAKQGEMSDQRAMVEECVRQVLQILKSSKER
jgi:Family of unknown function (DUF5908)